MPHIEASFWIQQLLNEDNMPSFRAGDLVTIRLTEEDAYELGCGTDAKPVVSVAGIIKHDPVPPPYTKTYTFYSKPQNGNAVSDNVEYSRRNFSKGFIGHLNITIDPSKPEGKRVTVEEVAP